MKQRIYNGHPLEFFNSSNDKKAEIKISGSDLILNPLDSSGTVIIGEAGTINDIEVGAVGTAVDFTFLGGGTLTSNGGTLTIGAEGDTIDLSNTTLSAISASVFTGSFVGDGTNLINVVPDLSSYSGNVGVTGNLTVTGKVTAEEFHTEFVSASIIYMSGSTKFGDTSDDVHDFTGSIKMKTGNLLVNMNKGGYIEADYDDSTGSLKFADGTRAKFGTGNDLQIYHDGANSYIHEAGTGDLYLRGGNDLIIQDSVGNTAIHINDSNTVELTFGGSKKFETKTDGILVTGTISGSNDLRLEGDANIRQLKLRPTGSFGTPGMMLFENDVVYVMGSDNGIILRNGDGSDNYYITTADHRWEVGSSEKMRLNSTGLGIGTNSPGAKLDVNGTIRTVTPLQYTSQVLANKIFSPGTDGSFATAQPFSNRWHDLFAFQRNFSVTQSISTNGTDFSDQTLDSAIFTRQSRVSTEVISSGERAVRFTFTGTAYCVGKYVAVFFGFSSPSPTVTITVESSANGTSWTSLSSGSVTASSNSHYVYLHTAAGDSGNNYLRVTFDKGNTDTKVVDICSLQLLTARHGDQGRGMEDEFPFTYDVNKKITLEGGAITGDNAKVISSRKFVARDGNGTMLTADDTLSGLAIADNGDGTFKGNGNNYLLRLDTDNNAIGDTAKIQFNDRAVVGWTGSAVYLGDGGGNKDIKLQVGTGNINLLTSNQTRLSVLTAGGIQFHSYGSGNNTGTAAYNLQVDSSGNIIESALGGGGTIDGSGAANRLAIWSDADTLTSDTDFTVNADCLFSTNAAISNKLAVKSATTHSLFDFYNNGTSYFNGDVTVDANFTQTTGTTATFSGDVTIGNTVPTLTFNNLAGGGLDPILEASHSFFKVKTTSITPFTINLSNGSSSFDGRVGINTATPAVDLHVNGEIRVDGNDGVATRKIRSSYFSSTTDIRVEAGSAGDVILGDNGAARLTLSGSNQIAKFEGDVIINRSSVLDTAKLSIQADAGEDVIGVQCNSNNTTTKLLNVFNSSGVDIVSLTVNNDSTPDLLFNTDDGSGSITEALKLDSSQNATFANGVSIGDSGAVYGTDNASAGIFLRAANRGVSGEFASGYARNLIRSDGSATIEIGDTTSLISLIKLNAGSSGTNGVVSFMTKNNERMRVHHDGNVGIGTNEPTAKLHVDNSSADAIIRLSKGSSTIGNIDFVNEGNRFSIQDDGAKRLAIDTNGKVGIGTDNPTANLEVAGAGAQLRVGPRYSSGGDRDFVDLIANGTDSKVKSDNERFHIENSLGDIIISPSGKVGIGTTSPQATLSIGDNIGSFNGISIGASANRDIRIGQGSSNNLVIGWKYNVTASSAYSVIENFGGNNPLILQGSGGNVGIGMLTPGYKLDVAGTSRIQGTIHMYGAVRNYSGDFSLQNGVLNNDILFKVNDGGTTTTAMMIHGATSQVGIGTTTPDRPLEIFKEQDGDFYGLKIAKLHSNTNQYTAEYANNQIKFSDNQNFMLFNGSNKVAAFHNSEVIFYTNGGSERMRIDNTGSVGIGTNVPASILHINTGTGTQNSNTVILDRLGSNDYSGLSFATAGTVDWSIGQNSAGNFEIFEDGQDAKTRVTVKTGGNVGIGATSPSFNLTVYDDGNSDCFPIVAGAGLSTSEFVGIGLSGFIASNGAVKAAMVLDRVGNFGTGDIHFLNNSTENNNNATLSDSKLTIKEDGKVGIGTTSPGGTLHVVGQSGGAGEIYISDIDNGGGTSDGFLLTKSGTDAFVYNRDNGMLRFGSNDRTTDLTIGSSGNIGIGTTNTSKINSTTTFFRPDPNGKLLVMNHNSGSFINLETNATGGGDQVGGIYFSKTGNQADAHFHVAGIDAVLLDHATDALDGGELRFFTKGTGAGDTSHHMILDHTGKLGIGQNIDPSYTLHVNASSTNEIARFASTDNDGLISIQDGNDTVYVGYDHSNTAMSLGFSNSFSSDNNITIKSDGKVGIGTDNPDDGDSTLGAPQLHVKGPGGTGRKLVARFQAASDENNSYASIILNHANDRGLIFSGGRASSNRAIGFINLLNHVGGEITDGITLHQVASGGAVTHVGIGTTTPGRKLTVSADIGVGNGNKLFLWNDHDDNYIKYNEWKMSASAGTDIKNIAATGNINIGAGNTDDLLVVSASGNVHVANDLVVAGKITAEEFHTEFVSASIIYQSGSTKFGDTSDDNHNFTGSVNVLGNINTGGGNAIFTEFIKSNSSVRINIDNDGNQTDRSFLVSKDNSLTELFRINEDASANFAGNVSVNGQLNVGDSNADILQVGLKSVVSYGENTDVDTGTETVKELAIATYQAAFFDFVIKNGTNVRAGTITAAHDGTNIEFNEVSTVDLGNTNDVKLSVDISGGNMRLRATTLSDNWSVKAFVRAIKV